MCNGENPIAAMRSAKDDVVALRPAYDIGRNSPLRRCRLRIDHPTGDHQSGQDDNDDLAHEATQIGAAVG